MSWVAVAVTAIAVGAGVQAVGQIQAGAAADVASKNEQDLLNYNAALKDQEADQERARGVAEAKKFEKQARRLKGSQVVQLARGGVLATEGTPSLLLEETALELEADRKTILEEGFLRGSFRQSEGIIQRFEGRSARARGSAAKKGSVLAAGGTLLTGIGSGASAAR